MSSTQRKILHSAYHWPYPNRTGRRVLFGAMMAIGISLVGTANADLTDHTEIATVDLSLAPKIPAEHVSVEERYSHPEATREQAAIDHAGRTPELAPRLRHLSHDDTLVVSTAVTLTDDHDHDGYYSSFTLAMDVDTRDQRDVYADVFLQRQYQSPRLLHSTRAFHLYGSSTSDEYRIDVTLTNDFPAGHYDLIIEIRDAWSDEWLDSVSEANFRNLGGLPLEDESHRIPRNDGSSVVVEYAGATTPLSLLLLAMIRLILRRRRSAPR